MCVFDADTYPCWLRHDVLGYEKHKNPIQIVTLQFWKKVYIQVTG